MKEGDTVFVSAAAGAVGSVAGQVARLRGAQVVGSAGSAAKVDYLTGELAFHAAFDYKQTPPAEALRELMPRFLEEVGGWVKSGELTYRETVVDGIERMPGAFIGLLEGENLGKMLVRVGPDPA